MNSRPRPRGQIAQAVPVGFGQLELQAVLAVGRAQRVRVDVRLFERRAREQLVDRPLLELDRVGLAVGGDAHQLFGQARIAVVVDAAFGDDEAGLPVADRARRPIVIVRAFTMRSSLRRR